MSLENLFNITIARETSTPSQAGFNKSLIMAYTTVIDERAKEYYSVAEMITDGFTTTDQAVLAATALFAQNPAPESVIIGREANTTVPTTRIYPVAAKVKEGQAYTVTLNGHTVTHTATGIDTVATICDALKILIDALTEHVTVTDGTTYLAIAANAVDDDYRLSVADRTIITQKNLTTDGGTHGIVEDIMAVKAENDDWYCVHLTNPSEARIAAAAVYIETLVRTMIVSNADDEIYDSGVSTDIASDLVTGAYARTMLIYHHKATTQYPCCAWAGKCLSSDPGSITWAFKTLATIDYTYLTTAERTAIENKYCNYYTRDNSINYTYRGIVPAGEWFDVVHGIDWTQVRMQEALFGKVVQASKKIPFTDSGIGIMKNALLGVLLEAASDEWNLYVNDPTVPTPSVSVPLAADVSDTNKGLRLLPSVTFSARLAGAIHKATVNGTVSYS